MTAESHVEPGFVSWQDDAWFTTTKNIPILNVTVGVFCGIIELGCVTSFSWRLIRARRSGKRWSHRRKYAARCGTEQ